MIPALYNYTNQYNGTRNPSTIHATDNALSLYFQRYLIQEAFSIFKWKMPKTWAKNYFLYSLYCFGYVAIIETDKFGVIPQACSLSGYDVFYRPNTATISNPLLRGIIQPKINEQCTLIQLEPDYCGLMDIVTRYADLMALTMQTAGSNIASSKLAYAFFAKNKAGAEAFKKMCDKIFSGEPTVILDAKMKNDDGTEAWQMFTNNLKNNYIAGDLLDDLQKLNNMFCTDVGIPNANTQKKERLISSEVERNTVETYTKADMWLESVKDGISRSIEMFPVLKGNFAVDWRFEPEVLNSGDAINSGAV